MEQGELADAINEYLLANKPPHPEVGWVELEALREKLTNEGKIPVKDKYDFPRTVRTIRDPRFESGYGCARLVRDEPWPVEGIRENHVRLLLALLVCHESGLTEVTPKQVAEYEGSSEGGAYQLLQAMIGAGVERTAVRTYKLAIELDTPLWITSGGMRSRKRLTTLATERAARSGGNIAVAVVPDKRLAQQLLDAVNTQMEFHRGALETLEVQQLRLQRILNLE